MRWLLYGIYNHCYYTRNFHWRHMLTSGIKWHCLLKPDDTTRGIVCYLYTQDICKQSVMTYWKYLIWRNSHSITLQSRLPTIIWLFNTYTSLIENQIEFSRHTQNLNRSYHCQTKSLHDHYMWRSLRTYPCSHTLYTIQ